MENLRGFGFLNQYLHQEKGLVDEWLLCCYNETVKNCFLLMDY